MNYKYESILLAEYTFILHNSNGYECGVIYGVNHENTIIRRIAGVSKKRSNPYYRIVDNNI